jgi:ferritin
MKLYNYVLSEGGQVTLKDIPAPKTEFDSPVAAIEGALGHEQAQTGRITALYELALKEKCYSTQVQLQWFITEQVEEEQTFRDILDKIKLIKDSPGAMMHYDHVMGHRE